MCFSRSCCRYDLYDDQKNDQRCSSLTWSMPAILRLSETCAERNEAGSIVICLMTRNRSLFSTTLTPNVKL
jgi:hypothetical protein